MLRLETDCHSEVIKSRQVMPSDGEKCNIFIFWVKMILSRDVKISCNQLRLNYLSTYIEVSE